MPNLLLVMLGGAIGAGLRYLAGRLAGGSAGSFPWATLGINLVGGLLMGLLAGAMVRYAISDAAWLFAGVGILGGFTTFSAFSFEAVVLLQRGAFALAAFYVAASVLGALALFAAGQHVARMPS